MSDLDRAKHIARDLRVKVDELNQLLVEASRAGLLVDISDAPQLVYSGQIPFLKTYEATISLIL